jgi:glutamate-5-semialdehyde dehydrogenase
VIPEVVEQARAAKQASRALAVLSSSEKNQILEKIAVALEQHSAAILAANAEDATKAKPLAERGELSQALYQRLVLTPEKLRGMIAGVRAVASLPDPVGHTLAKTVLDDGLVLEKVACPLGLLAVIFESRPDAITQITSLAIKSGNAVILKGGSEVERTMHAALEAIHSALGDTVPKAAVMGVYGREAVATLLALDKVIDLIIPRGSNALVQHIQKSTLIPVLGHADGVCHVYIDAAANVEMAIRIAVDSKVQYPAACNAVETLLVHRDIAPRCLPALSASLVEAGVRVRGCALTIALMPGVVMDAVADDEWHTEYSDLVVAIRVVDDLNAALDHIERYGSHHTDAIITEDMQAAKRFLNEVDSANVYHNCSTRFADGYRYGFGAEVGISTSKLHARGPVGLEGLVTYKYKLEGSGQIVKDYSGPAARKFLHIRLDP